jgi:hypothetical protein
MALDPRKVRRLVAVKGAGTPHPAQLRPARITAVGAGTTVTVKVLHKTGETYTLPKWSRASPAVTGWIRT